jgi:hypothetical protein
MTAQRMVIDCGTGDFVAKTMTPAEVAALASHRTLADGPPRDTQIVAAIDEAISGMRTAATPGEQASAFVAGLEKLRAVFAGTDSG